jgi:hypothetical protein
MMKVLLFISVLLIAALMLWGLFDSFVKGRWRRRLAREQARRQIEMSKLERDIAAHDERTIETLVNAFEEILDRTR